MTERLLQPSVRDDRGLAIDTAQARLQRLDLRRLLVYAVREVTPTALPHLVEQFHVGGLEGGAWATTEAERRQLVIDGIAWHRLKGTLGGLRWTGRRAGLAIVRAITPPARVYCAPTLTRPEREAFLARYPQLRLYRYRSRGQRLANGWYCNAAYVAGRQYPVVTDAILRLGWRAFLWQAAGGETPLTTLVRELARDQALAVLDLAIRRPGAAGWGTYPNRPPPGHQYLVSQDGGGRLFNVRLDQPYRAFDETVHTHAARPGLGLIEIRYQPVAAPGWRHGVHLGGGRDRLVAAAQDPAPPSPWRWQRPCVAGYLCDNGARDRLYRRFHLFDPTVAVGRRGKSTHLGTLKLGMPAYTAELRTSQPARRSPRLMGRYCDGYLAPRTVSRLETGRAVLRQAAAARDRVWLDSHDLQPVASSGGALAGRYVAGQIISRSSA
jgi:hypothetical protein